MTDVDTTGYHEVMPYTNGEGGGISGGIMCEVIQEEEAAQ